MDTQCFATAHKYIHLLGQGCSLPRTVKSPEEHAAAARKVAKPGDTTLHSRAGSRILLPCPTKEISCAKITEQNLATWPEPEIQPWREWGSPSPGAPRGAPAQTST